jgi:hypothetical protein
MVANEAQPRLGNMHRRSVTISKCLSILVGALLLAVGQAEAQSQPATAPAAAAPSAQADAAALAAKRAYAKRLEALNRRREAEARMAETLKNPPAGAPHWMKRASERSKAAAGQPAAAKGNAR